MRFQILLFVFSLFANCANADTIYEDIESEKIDVKIRYVGHQILLSLGDSTSRVLPVQHHDGVYVIGFEKPISILPSALVASIDQSVSSTMLPAQYIVMVKPCDSDAILYSFERTTSDTLSSIQCGGRLLDLGCYTVHLRFLEFQQKSRAGFVSLILALIVLIAGIGWIYYKRYRKSNTNSVRIGRYHFNTKAMYLIYEGERVQMTTRESDLLLLLYKSINNTVKKEDILHEIWEDEGSYDGRTLDVFISKLRKKLAYDPRVKLVNVKGVGYKMVIED